MLLNTSIIMVFLRSSESDLTSTVWISFLSSRGHGLVDEDKKVCRRRKLIRATLWLIDVTAVK